MTTLMLKIQAAALIASNTYGVDKGLIMAMIEVESQYKQYAVGSSHGEIGLMQLRREFHPCASFDVFENIMCGTKYLARIKEIRRDWGDAYFVAYNFGPYAPVKEPKKTAYYRKVMGVMK